MLYYNFTQDNGSCSENNYWKLGDNSENFSQSANYHLPPLLQKMVANM